MRANIYRTYQFIDKDPVIDNLRTIVEENGLSGKHKIICELSGVSPSTIFNWFKGNTKRPQHATVAAVSSSLGYEMEFVRARRVDVDKERELAAKWASNQEAKKQRQLTRKANKLLKNGGKESRASR